MVWWSAVAAVAVSPLRIDGLVAAVFTPFGPDGHVNFAAVPRQHAYLAATGVQWVYVAGTTGESLSLTVEERKQLTEAWVRAGARVIAHVGAESIVDARELARHAAAAGVHAVAAMPPVFFKPVDADALAATISSICGAAPSLPCYYYHVPSMTGYDKPMLDFVRAIEPLAPNFAGIKYTGLYTSPGFMDAERVLAYGDGKYEVLCGREEMTLQALAIGITGFVGSQMNFAGDLFNALRLGFAAEGLTAASAPRLRALQLRGIELIAAWADASPPGVNGAKAFMTLAGVDVGDARLPAVPVGTAHEALQEAFRRFCGKAGVFDLKMCGSTRLV